jgi:hypothetical protein
MPSASVQDDRHSEPRSPAHAAQRQAQIPAERFEWTDGVHAIDLLADADRVAELQMRCPTRSVGRHPAREVLVGLDLEVRAQFRGAIAIQGRSAEEPAPAHDSLR